LDYIFVRKPKIDRRAAAILVKTATARLRKLIGDGTHVYLLGARAQGTMAL
jgi:hypothetical protein